jgi:hypothetical protein
MRTVPTMIRVLSTAAVLVGAVGCGSSASPAADAAGEPDAPLEDAASDAATIVGCFVPGLGVAPDRCSPGERAAHGQCVFDRCGAATASCFGASARSGSYGGACGDWLSCLSSCGCGNLPCLAGCGEAPAACQRCQEDVATCQQASCPRPACLQPADAAAPDAPAPDAVSPDLGAPPLSLPDAGGGTCDDLMRCCLAISDEAKKAVCVGQVEPLRMLGGDALCGPAYAARKMIGECP